MMLSELLFKLFFLTALWSSALSPVLAQYPEGPPPPGDPRAEKVADQIVKTFYERLDFGDVYREWYIKNEKFRFAEVNIVIGNFIQSGDGVAGLRNPPARTIEQAAMERAYIANGNYHWNIDAAALTRDETKDAAFEQAIKEAWPKYYEPLNQKANWPILTSKELDDRVTSRFVGLAEVFRRHVVQDRFGSALFLKRQAAVQESSPPDPLNGLIDLFSDAGVTRADHIYLARRGSIYIYLIEENGELRMFSFTSRIRD